MHSIARLRVWIALVALTGAPVALADDPPEIAIDADDVVVTSDARVRPGTYRVVDANGDGVIHVRGKGVRLDLTGVTLDGARPGVDAEERHRIGGYEVFVLT